MGQESTNGRPGGKADGTGGGENPKSETQHTRGGRYRTQRSGPTAAIMQLPPPGSFGREGDSSDRGGRTHRRPTRG